MKRHALALVGGSLGPASAPTLHAQGQAQSQAARPAPSRALLLLRQSANYASAEKEQGDQAAFQHGYEEISQSFERYRTVARQKPADRYPEADREDDHEQRPGDRSA